MNPPSNVVVKKHILLVFSVISCMFTTMGWYLGTTNWLWKTTQSWLVLVASVISTPIAVTAAISMRQSFLLTYAIIGILEIIFKIVFIVNVYRKKIEVSSRCTMFYQIPPDCADWRLDDLNLTNSAVFHIVSSIAHLFLIMFSVQLLHYQRKLDHMRSKVVGIENLSYSYSTSSIDTIAFHTTTTRDNVSSSTCTGQSNVLITQSDPGQRQDGASYGTFRRICNRFRKFATESV